MKDFRLKVTYEDIPVGEYSANSITGLLWVGIKHRVEHLLNGEGWRDRFSLYKENYVTYT